MIAKPKRLCSFLLLLSVCILCCSCGTKNDSSLSIEESVTIEDLQPETTIPEPTVTVEPEVDETPEIEEVSYDIIPDEYLYSIDISINPLVRLYFNEDNVVNGVEYLNNDAIDAYAELDILNLSMDDAISELLEAADTKQYLQIDSTVSLTLSQAAPTVSDSQMLVNAAKSVDTYYDAMDGENELHPEVELYVAEEVTTVAQINVPQKCTACDGKGASCSECNGRGIVHCKRCNGGYETCGVCGGNGLDPTDGVRACGGCGGAGGFSCSWCGGALEHICPICWGENTCSACDGNGYY